MVSLHFGTDLFLYENFLWLATERIYLCHDWLCKIEIHACLSITDRRVSLTIYSVSQSIGLQDSTENIIKHDRENDDHQSVSDALR